MIRQLVQSLRLLIGDNVRQPESRPRHRVVQRGDGSFHVETDCGYYTSVFTSRDQNSAIEFCRALYAQDEAERQKHRVIRQVWP